MSTNTTGGEKGSRTSALYRLALGLYPRRIRGERDQLAQLFDDLLAAARGRGGLPTLVFVARSFADVLLFGAPLRVLEIFGPNRARPNPSPSPPAPQRQSGLREVLLGAFAQDLQYARRHFVRRRGVTLASITSLALGIAAVTAIFSLFDALVLRPVAIAHPDRLVAMVSLREHGTNSTFPYPDFRVVRAAVADRVAMVAHSTRPTSLTIGNGEAAATERIFVSLVSHDYFEALGVHPHLGRAFAKLAEGRGPAVAVASHGFWTGRLASDPEVVGRTVHLNDRPVTLIGVAPPAFRGLDGNVEPALYLPLERQPVLAGEDYLQGDGASWLYWAGVLRPGVGLEQAREYLEAVTMAHWAEIGRDWELGVELRNTPTGFPQPLRDYRPFVQLSMAVVGLVLLIACANVAGLLLAAGAGRVREIAARRCLGAGRARLARQLMTESLLLGAASGVTGVGLAALLVRALVRMEPLATQLSGLEVRIDLRVLAFALLATFVVSTLFGLAPVLQLVRRDAVAALRGSGGTGEHGRLLGQRTLVVAQIAMSFATLVLATLFAFSLLGLQGIDPGIERAPVLLGSVDLRAAGYTPERVVGFWDELLRRVDGLPGVGSVALARTRPVSPAGSRMGYQVPGYMPTPSDDMELDTNVVSLGYFETLGIEIESGRAFERRDAAPEAQPVVMVNRMFAERFFAGLDPVGRVIEAPFFGGQALPSEPGDELPELRIIGIVADGKYRSLREDPRPMVYRLLEREGARLATRSTLLVATRGEPLALYEMVRATLHALDPRVPLYNVITLEEQLARAVANERLTTLLLGGLATFAVVLAGIGLFALLSYWVRLRRPEIGIRMALGARPRDVVRAVVGFALVLVAIGCLVGTALALPLGQLLEAQLYGIRPSHPGVYLAGVVLLVLIATLAGFLPTRRAARVDPMQTLRHE